jgi:DNA-binding Lrp family transcriptional regulator
MSDVAALVDEAVASTPVYDLHTHLYPPAFGKLMLWGIDELLTYHYLIGESVRASAIPYDRFWRMTQPQQADFIWRTLFVERAPLSEACRGVLTVLRRLGLDVTSKDLAAYRDFFRSQNPAGYTDRVLELANVHTVVMTNDPLDPPERDLWLQGPQRDPRFKAVLRIDPLLLDWPNVSERLRALGYDVALDLGGRTMAELRRFVSEWIDRMKAVYVAVSLPPEWNYPDGAPSTRVADEAVLPVCRERNLPFALMIGVTRQANPELRMAGDSLAKADLCSLHRLCSENPRNKFMATVLSRENQHELAVAGRLHPNLFVFGCWWYVNNPSLIEEITRMRVELLGTEFAPQHSDARVLDQLVYKWDHSRAVLAKVLKDKFTDLSQTGWPVTREEIERTVRGYLSDNFERFLARTM